MQNTWNCHLELDLLSAKDLSFFFLLLQKERKTIVLLLRFIPKHSGKSPHNHCAQCVSQAWNPGRVALLCSLQVLGPRQRVLLMTCWENRIAPGLKPLSHLLLMLYQCSARTLILTSTTANLPISSSSRRKYPNWWNVSFSCLSSARITNCTSWGTLNAEAGIWWWIKKRERLKLKSSTVLDPEWCLSLLLVSRWGFSFPPLSTPTVLARRYLCTREKATHKATCDGEGAKQVFPVSVLFLMV